MAPATGSARSNGSCVISQIKNNLGRLDLPSLRYVIQPATVDTEEGPGEVGRLVMIGESDRSVHDILRDRHDDDDRAERDEVAEWLQAYLVHSKGEASAAAVLKAGVAAGYSRDQLKRAKRRAGVNTRKDGFDGGWVWALGAEWLAAAPEGSTQGSEESGDTEPAPFAPLALPWGRGPERCAGCNRPLAADYRDRGWTRHPYCQPEKETA